MNILDSNFRELKVINNKNMELSYLKNSIKKITDSKFHSKIYSGFESELSKNIENEYNFTKKTREHRPLEYTIVDYLEQYEGKEILEYKILVDRDNSNIRKIIFQKIDNKVFEKLHFKEEYLTLYNSPICSDYNKKYIGHGQQFKYNDVIFRYIRIGEYVPKDEPFIVSDNFYKDSLFIICIYDKNINKYRILSIANYFNHDTILETFNTFTNIELIAKLKNNIKKYSEYVKSFR